MNYYGNSNIKQSPIRGLSGMGGGIFIPVGVPEDVGNEFVVVQSRRNSTEACDGTYNATNTQCLMRGYAESAGDHETNEKFNDGYMQVLKGTSMKVQMWGAAGGAGNSSFRGDAGGGQYIEAQLDFTSGGTLYWMVGAGGGKGQPSNEIGSGGWGGGGSCGFESNTLAGGGGSANGPQVGYSGTAFSNGGEATTYSQAQVNRGAQGGGGGGLVGLFFANEETGQTASNSDASSNTCIVTAGGGGGYGGHNPGEDGSGGGASHPNSANANAAGTGQAGAPGGIGFGGGGMQRGGGGGAGYYGGAGGNDNDAYGPGPNGDRQGGGGGYGNVTAQSGVDGITISNTTIQAGSTNNVGNDGGSGHTGEYGCCNPEDASGYGGLMRITILT